MKLGNWSLLLVVALIAAACVVPVSTPAEPLAEPAAEEPAAAPTAAPEAKEPVKLTYWHIGGLLTEIEVARDETEKWNASHPDIP